MYRPNGGQRARRWLQMQWVRRTVMAGGTAIVVRGHGGPIRVALVDGRVTWSKLIPGLAHNRVRKAIIVDDGGRPLDMLIDHGLSLSCRQRMDP